MRLHIEIMQQANTEKHTNASPILATRFEGADVLRISLRKFDSLLARGELGYVRIDGKVLIPYSELLRFIRARMVPAIAEMEPVTA
jgi:excisionase family DNA binding protein